MSGLLDPVRPNARNRNKPQKILKLEKKNQKTTIKSKKNNSTFPKPESKKRVIGSGIDSGRERGGGVII